MLAGLKHIVRSNIQDIAESSYLNCHTKGVHSFMLVDYPGRSIRVFYATTDHELWRNEDALLKVKNGHKMSVGLHPHHRHLTLEVIYGGLKNIIACEDKYTAHPVLLDHFEYESHILDGQMKFIKKRENVGFVLCSNQYLDKGKSVFLDAGQLHTIAIEKGKACAWLVFEGDEDHGYINQCFSNDDLENASTEGLYIRPTEDETKDYLAQIGLY